MIIRPLFFKVVSDTKKNLSKHRIDHAQKFFKLIFSRNECIISLNGSDLSRKLMAEHIIEKNIKSPKEYNQHVINLIEKGLKQFIYYANHKILIYNDNEIKFTTYYENEYLGF